MDKRFSVGFLVVLLILNVMTLIINGITTFRISVCSCLCIALGCLVYLARKKKVGCKV